VSEGIEDLTGGVAVGLNPEDIMDKDRFWKEQLMEVNKKYLFGCSSHLAFRKGIYETHAYVVLQAWEEGDLKLVKIRNPWGEREWMGDWSDGDKLWTAEMMTKLNRELCIFFFFSIGEEGQELTRRATIDTFGDDGVFWMTYKDFLKHFRAISRTRLFDESWKVATRWTSVNVPWTPDFLDTKFQFTLSKPGPVVIVLSQPDDRYFRGLTGRFIHQLHFRLHEQSASSDDETDPEAGWIVRSMHASGNDPRNTRSVSAEVEDLPAGTYTVLIKITTRRWDDDNTFAETIAETAQKRKEKLLGVGRRFDYAQSKGDRRGAERRARQIKASDAFAKHLLALRRQRKITRDSRARKRRRDERRKAVEEAWTRRFKFEQWKQEKRLQKRDRAKSIREQAAANAAEAAADAAAKTAADAVGLDAKRTAEAGNVAGSEAAKAEDASVVVSPGDVSPEAAPPPAASSSSPSEGAPISPLAKTSLETTTTTTAPTAETRDAEGNAETKEARETKSDAPTKALSELTLDPITTIATAEATAAAVAAEAATRTVVTSAATAAAAETSGDKPSGNIVKGEVKNEEAQKYSTAELKIDEASVSNKEEAAPPNEGPPPVEGGGEEEEDEEFFYEPSIAAPPELDDDDFPWDAEM
jgi:hypothetical protein